MKIAVCMKQVPEYAEGNMDPETGLLIRSGLKSRINLNDLAALEAALQLREAAGGTVSVFTMGPATAEAVIREAYAIGADDGYLLCDGKFAGADILATSYTLMCGIRHTDTYDLILFGKQTTDGDTSFVSGAVAEWMQLPYLACADRIERRSDRELYVHYQKETQEISAGIHLPCVLSVDREAFLPRMPSLKRKIESKKMRVPVLGQKDIAGENAAYFGTEGSATRVKKIYPPRLTGRNRVVYDTEGNSAEYILNIVSPWAIKEEQV